MVVKLDAGGEINIPVTLDSHDSYNGFFRYTYELRLPYKGVMLISILCLDSESYFNTNQAFGMSEADLEQLLYADSYWKHIPDSPFTLRASERDFVLFPLQDIAPNLRDPISNLTVKELIKGLKNYYIVEKLNYRNLL